MLVSVDDRNMRTKQNYVLVTTACAGITQTSLGDQLWRPSLSAMIREADLIGQAQIIAYEGCLPQERRLNLRTVSYRISWECVFFASPIAQLNHPNGAWPTTLRSSEPRCASDWEGKNILVFAQTGKEARCELVGDPELSMVAINDSQIEAPSEWRLSVEQFPRIDGTQTVSLSALRSSIKEWLPDDGPAEFVTDTNGLLVWIGPPSHRSAITACTFTIDLPKERSKRLDEGIRAFIDPCRLQTWKDFDDPLVERQGRHRVFGNWRSGYLIIDRIEEMSTGRVITDERVERKTR